MRNLRLLLLMTTILPAVCLAADTGCEFIAPDHWVYTALQRFEALGFCDLPSTRPFTRNQIIEFGEAIEKSIADSGRLLSSRDGYELSRLQQEFILLDARLQPKIRYDPPAVYFTDRKISFEGDASLGFSSKKDYFSSSTEYFLTGRPGGKFHVSNYLTYRFRYDLVFGPEHGFRARNQKPSNREKSFKGLTSLFELSSVVFHWGKMDLFMGREYADWGPSNWTNLILSGQAGSLDQTGIRLASGRFSMSMIHAQLSLEKQRHLAAHRVEIRMGGILAGISESVVYAGRGFDPVYAFPLSSFYANQFNEKGDDNILWSVDIKARPIRNLMLTGSLLIDDFQFERDGSAPDKIGFDVGLRAAFDDPLPVTVQAYYRYVDIYTYTHRDTATDYASGAGLPGEGDPLLGEAVGPDSDQWRIEIRSFPMRNVPVTLGVFGLRAGSGNDFEPYHHGSDPYPAFPSGTVERSFGIDSSVVWELDGASSVSMSWAWKSIHNYNHIDNNNTETASFKLAVIVDL